MAVVSNFVVRLVLMMPRGGFFLLRILCRFIPGLRKYPVAMPMAPSVMLQADLSNNAFYPLLKYGLYRHQVTEDLVIGTFLSEGDCVVDVGANIGYISVLCAECTGTGTVHSIEPSAVCIGYINQLASQLKQIRPWNLAVSNISGKVRFKDEVMSDRSHVINIRDDCGYVVDCVSLDDWAARNNIGRGDFLKVDAEGHDIKVLEGALGMIETSKPIILFEAFSSEDVALVGSLLSRLDVGYKIYGVYNKYPISAIGGSRKTNNYFAVPQSRSDDVPAFLFRRGFLALTNSGMVV